MKFIRIILATLIFFGSVFPCVDAESISFSDETVLSVKVETTHSDTKDNCSPFCICTCCSNSFSMEFQTILNTSIPSEDSIIHLQDNYHFNPLLSIWQPPKV